MDNFFKKIQKGIENNTSKNQSSSSNKKRNKNKKNFFSPKDDRGGGKSLGGSKPGKVICVILEGTGPIGVKVERTSNGRGYAIISKVHPNTQAETAGLQRGDIICHPDSNGEEEIMYDQFLAMANSNRRPLVFDVRRIESNTNNDQISSASSNKKKTSAESDARRQAVIAAAEARDKAHKTKTKPLPKTRGGELTIAEQKKIAQQKEENLKKNELHMMQDKPLSKETREAVEAAKTNELTHASTLGYNPYEKKNVTAGQAKTATVAMTHGTMSANSTDEPTAMPSSSSPAQTRNNHPETESHIIQSINVDFDNAFELFVTNNSDPAKSLAIQQKIIFNATSPSKGQEEGDDNYESSSKFRKVRLSNPKIKAAIADKAGAIDIMLVTGFVLSENEEDGETYLVYPPGNTGPIWLPEALKKMEQYK